MKTGININTPEQDSDIEEFIIPPYQHFSSTYILSEHWFYISGPIGHPSQYTEMVHTIRTAQQGDVIYIVFNTPGGQLDTGIQILNALHGSKAQTIAILDAEANSMGAILFLACKQFQVNDHCRMMFHNFSGGSTPGKGNEQIQELTAAIQLYNSLLKSVCVPFLSLEEVSNITKGGDIWLDSSHIKKRLKQQSTKLATKKVQSRQEEVGVNEST